MPLILNFNPFRYCFRFLFFLLAAFAGTGWWGAGSAAEPLGCPRPGRPGWRHGRGARAGPDVRESAADPVRGQGLDGVGPAFLSAGNPRCPLKSATHCRNTPTGFQQKWKSSTLGILWLVSGCPVESGYRWHGRAWLTVTFPDDHPARIPVQDNDLAGPQVADPGTTVLPVSGIRWLRELVRGRGAAPTAERSRERPQQSRNLRHPPHRVRPRPLDPHPTCPSYGGKPQSTHPNALVARNTIKTVSLSKPFSEPPQVGHEA
jgi:hypothetical protein